MPLKSNAPRRLGRRLEDYADRFVHFFRGELRLAHREAENRAHIATTADHPFLGCNPCQVSMPEPAAALDDAPRSNPRAVPRE